MSNNFINLDSSSLTNIKVKNFKLVLGCKRENPINGKIYKKCKNFNLAIIISLNNLSDS